jgi:hypothetical protein
MLPDELLHQPDTFLILAHLDGNATRAEQFRLALAGRSGSPAADTFAAMHDNRTDWDAAFEQSLAAFFNGGI